MGKASSSSSSSMSSSSNKHRNRRLAISTASSDLSQQQHQLLHTDLSLGLGIPINTHHQQQHHHVDSSISRGEWQQPPYVNGCGDWGSENSSLFVKVYMEGIPIGRKLNILAHESYHELVSTLENMFDTTILWGTEMDGMQAERCHVLTYEDEEGDLVMVGDVPWEMFVSAVKRLKITRVDAFGC